jgi:RNA polymerase sigma-70 factor (ECF subfamily)
VDTFSKFYRANKGKLFGYLMRMTGDYQLSRDIMQESFTRLLGRYGPKSPDVSLLYTIARNAVFDNARKRVPTAKYLEGTVRDSIDPEQETLIREEYRAVLSAMQQLGKNEREVLSLAVSSDMTYREIGAITKMSESNVKVKIHRARTKLRKILKKGA